MNKPEADHTRRGRPATPATPDAPPVIDDSGLAFLGRLAHDLRGPLSPLQTAAYLLRRQDIDPLRRSELLDIIDRQAARLGGMLQELSDWMRAQSGGLGARRDLISVPMLIELGCAKLAAAGGTIDVPESLDEVEILGDDQHLVQMIATLVGYMQGRAGPTDVGVSASLHDGQLIITIAPCHIAPRHATVGPASEPTTKPPETLASLFSAPEKAPFDEGLGLRMLIARNIAQAHRGSVSAQASASGHESLRVELPLR